MISRPSAPLFRIGIIGGGPGALVTAYRFCQQLQVSVDLTIFEASGRLGGKVSTLSFDHAPVRYEAGAAELYDYSPLGDDPLRTLIAELGLRTRPMQGGAVVMDGVILQTEADLLAHLGAPAVAELKRFRERSRAAIRPQDYYEPNWELYNADPLSRQRFDELLGTLTDPRAQRYVQIATRSDLACEPAQTNATYGLQNYLMDEPDYLRLYTIEGGIERLTEELADRIAARILLRHRVTTVERTAAGSYQVTAQSGGATVTESFDFVVAALPVNWLSSVRWLGGALPAAMAAHVRQYDYPAHYLRISLLFDRPFWRERVHGDYFMLDAFGGCCVYDESGRGGDERFGALGWLLAGDAALNWSNLADADLIDAALHSLPSAMLPSSAAFREGRVHRWVGAVNALPSGYPAVDPALRHVPEPLDHPQLFLVGDYLFDSTLNGVVDSADLVVESILEIAREDLGAAPAERPAEIRFVAAPGP